MSPVLTFEIFGRHFAVASYSTMMYLAAVVIFGLGLVITTRRGLPPWRVSVCLLVMAVSVPLGARLLHAATNFSLYMVEPWRLYSLDYRGFSLYGGLVLATVVGVIIARRLHVDIIRFGDSMAPALGCGLAIMRVGCFLAGCCFGVQTDLPWAVVFPPGSNAHIYQLFNGLDIFSRGPAPVHPTQLYEMAAGLIGAALAWSLLSRRSPDGSAFLAFVIWFTAFRWANHYLRVPPAAAFEMPGWFYPVLYAAIIGLCLFFWVRRDLLDIFRMPRLAHDAKMTWKSPALHAGQSSSRGKSNG